MPLGLAVMITLALALAIGLLAGTISGDVKRGQQLSSLLLTLLFLPPFLLIQFSDIRAPPLTIQAIMQINPVTYVFMVFESIFVSDIQGALTYLPIVAFFPVLFLGLTV